MMIKVDSKNNLLYWNNRSYRCAIGKNGATMEKIEGDGKTPLGQFPILEVYWRKDRADLPKIQLPTRQILKSTGWCDDPEHAAYNFPVPLPFSARHEVFWREDGCYDIVVVIGYNRNPTIRGRGSAIFLHCAKPDFAGTEGCVAIDKKDLLSILPEFTPQTTIDIR
ncbi:MAG: hypothetical protein EYC62_03700 [Alphaproteobacteria bacterium]|nr:MAG: hypothetical protein EYC62_03700 [Alphaproteobacteria bacterium]